jgi:molybdopterin converting factor small subunit
MAISVNVRFSAALAQTIGTPRLRLALADGATVGNLLDQLAAEQGALVNRLSHLVVAVAGRHVGRDEPLQDGQEVVLVMPAAGGAHAQPALPTILPTGGSAW